MLRYLLLLVEGGIYTDTDTRLRKPPSRWGRGATLWADGKGLSKDEKNRIAVGERWEDVLGPPSVVIGIEADVGEREDWNDWWPRPVSPESRVRSATRSARCRCVDHELELTNLDPDSSMDNSIGPFPPYTHVGHPPYPPFHSESSRLGPYAPN